MFPRARDLLSVFAIVIAFTFSHVAAEEYPNRVVKIVAPMAAGGGTDTVARLFAQKISARLGQPVIVENRAGAGGQIGAEAVASAPPDGYTLLFGSSSAVTLPYLRKTRFDLMRDFVPVGQVGIGSFVLTISPSLPFKALEEFLASAKANPGKYTFGSPGSCSAGHLALHLLKARTGIEMVHVPFKSSTEIAQAMIAGQIDCAIDIIPIQKAVHRCSVVARPCDYRRGARSKPARASHVR
jgi:tripartite-type tricarboxylate transporter receptor subunit TctC